MGNLPPIDQPVRIPIVLQTPEVLMDHHFQGQPVYPAVEAMETLACCVRKNFPRHRIDHIADARFDKFLPMHPGADTIDAFAEFQQREGDAAIQATLLTHTKAPKAAFTRTKTHVRMTFLTSAVTPQRPPMDMAAAVEGVCTVVDPEAIYRELVPFGPAFRNICAPLHISPDGALARINTPPSPGTEYDRLLGSGFALDAALHAACVWAQRYHGVVAFPVAIDRRAVLHHVSPGKTCFGRVFPRETSGDTLIFDILLFDPEGKLCEISQGVHMRDVSGGRLKPPGRLCAGTGMDLPSALGLGSNSLSIVEIDAAADFAHLALTPLEEKRYGKMGEKRRRSFTAARLALKRLYRKCTGKDDTPADRIDTVCKDAPLPCMRGDSLTEDLYCSVSHDRRFAIAVAGTRPVGIDVELISNKALNSARLYMNDAELKQTAASSMEAHLIALRIWTIKEAAAKAAGINLAEAWRRVQVETVNETQSTLSFDGQSIVARHATIGMHLFTALTLQDIAVPV